jgi:ABC-type transport system involved in cytochrome c biogenesis permease subunit
LREILNLPLFDSHSRRLQYASLDEVEHSPVLGRLWGKLQERSEREGKQFHLTGVDKKIKDLVDAYDAYRQLTFDPRSPEASHRRFLHRVRVAVDTWRKLAAGLQQSDHLRNDEETRRLMVQAGVALQQLVGEVHANSFSLEEAETAVAAFRRLAESLADRLANDQNRALASMAAEVRRQTIEMHLALADNGEALRLTPSLSPAALEENRVPGDDAQPWLSVQALLLGPSDLLRDYPQPELQAVRSAFTEVKKAYLDRGAADRSERFADAMNQFAGAVRAFGDQTEPLREKLPIQYRDQELIDTTAYPPPGSTTFEVLYNRLDPFFWSWSISLAAVLCLSFSWGALRKAMFWLGLIVLLIAQAFTLAGFGLRMYVTGLVPLTGMFETVVFVALGVALLGAWFALLPLFQAGLREAWQLTSVQGPKTEGGIVMRKPSFLVIRGFLLLLRAGWMIVVVLAIVRWRDGFGWGLFDLLPRTALGAAKPSANDVLVWLAGWCIIVAAVYFVPRLAVALLAASVTIPRAWLRERTTDPMEEVMRRRLFVLGGAAMGCLAVVLACYAPASVMKRSMGAVAPVLRDNHWLVVHVVTIMASYAAAAIALVLGNVALGYYLFAPYRADPSTPDGAERRPLRWRPPETCATLAGFTYTAVQITVLLLTAGTILGALWADKAWGRFWAWDPKEVWALISLLVYLLILHARCIGWARDFGMAVAAVLGATAVLFTWYGVNFLLGSGMHAYGAGSGGQWSVGAAVALNWLFLAAAAIRYLVNRGGGDLSTEDANPSQQGMNHA